MKPIVKQRILKDIFTDMQLNYPEIIPPEVEIKYQWLDELKIIVNGLVKLQVLTYESKQKTYK